MEVRSTEPGIVQFWGTATVQPQRSRVELKRPTVRIRRKKESGGDMFESAVLKTVSRIAKKRKSKKIAEDYQLRKLVSSNMVSSHKTKDRLDLCKKISCLLGNRSRRGDRTDKNEMSDLVNAAIVESKATKQLFESSTSSAHDICARGLALHKQHAAADVSIIDLVMASSGATAEHQVSKITTLNDGNQELLISAASHVSDMSLGYAAPSVQTSPLDQPIIQVNFGLQFGFALHTNLQAARGRILNKKLNKSLMAWSHSQLQFCFRSWRAIYRYRLFRRRTLLRKGFQMLRSNSGRYHHLILSLNHQLHCYQRITLLQSVFVVWYRYVKTIIARRANDFDPSFTNFPSWTVVYDKMQKSEKDMMLFLARFQFIIKTLSFWRWRVFSSCKQHKREQQELAVKQEGRKYLRTFFATWNIQFRFHRAIRLRQTNFLRRWFGELRRYTLVRISKKNLIAKKNNDRVRATFRQWIAAGELRKIWGRVKLSEFNRRRLRLRFYGFSLANNRICMLLWRCWSKMTLYTKWNQQVKELFYKSYVTDVESGLYDHTNEERYQIAVCGMHWNPSDYEQLLPSQAGITPASLEAVAALRIPEDELFRTSSRLSRLSYCSTATRRSSAFSSASSGQFFHDDATVLKKFKSIYQLPVVDALQTSDMIHDTSRLECLRIIRWTTERYSTADALFTGYSIARSNPAFTVPKSTNGRFIVCAVAGISKSGKRKKRNTKKQKPPRVPLASPGFSNAALVV